MICPKLRLLLDSYSECRREDKPRGTKKVTEVCRKGILKTETLCRVWFFFSLLKRKTFFPAFVLPHKIIKNFLPATAIRQEEYIF